MARHIRRKALMFLLSVVVFVVVMFASSAVAYAPREDTQHAKAMYTQELEVSALLSETP